MKRTDLVIGALYQYTIKSEDFKRVMTLEYIGDFRELYPHLGITHCANLFFVGSDKTNDYIAANHYTLSDYDLNFMEAL